MSKFKKIETIGIIKDTGIVPVFYSPDIELTKKVVKACYDGGIRAFEFTNRGKEVKAQRRKVRCLPAEASEDSHFPSEAPRSR